MFNTNFLLISKITTSFLGASVTRNTSFIVTPGLDEFHTGCLGQPMIIPKLLWSGLRGTPRPCCPEEVGINVLIGRDLLGILAKSTCSYSVFGIV